MVGESLKVMEETIAMVGEICLRHIRSRDILLQVEKFSILNIIVRWLFHDMIRCGTKLKVAMKILGG